MKNSNSELLSACLDGEVGAFERRRALDELSKHDDQQAALSRYALMGEAIRGQHKPLVAAKSSFLQGIQEQLEIEEQLQNKGDTVATSLAEQAGQPAAANDASWFGFMRYGMAAAVGAVTMAVVLSQFGADEPATETMAMAQVNEVTVANPSAASDGQGQVVPLRATPAMVVSSSQSRPLSRIDPETQAVLKNYISNHVKYASTNPVVPTVQRAVAYKQ